MTVLAAALAGAVVTTVVWWMAAPVFDADTFRRTNFRGRDLPTAAGVVLIVAVVAVEAVLALVEAAGGDPHELTVPGRRLVVLGGLAFALLGLLDDLAGAGESFGFRGHLRSLAKGRLTTGGIKLFGGGAVGVILAANIEPRSFGRVLADGAMIALCANLANLFDRAPGRVAKLGLGSFVVLAVATGVPDTLAGPALVAGGLLALTVPDVRERLMLGDTGANVIGATLGIGVLVSASPGVRTGVLVGVVVLNLASELVSFSKVIDRTPPLRWLDRLGRTA